MIKKEQISYSASTSSKIVAFRAKKDLYEFLSNLHNRSEFITNLITKTKAYDNFLLQKRANDNQPFLDF